MFSFFDGSNVFEVDGEILLSDTAQSCWSPSVWKFAPFNPLEAELAPL